VNGSTVVSILCVLVVFQTQKRLRQPSSFLHIGPNCSVQKLMTSPAFVAVTLVVDHLLYTSGTAEENAHETCSKIMHLCSSLILCQTCRWLTYVLTTFFELPMLHFLPLITVCLLLATDTETHTARLSNDHLLFQFCLPFSSLSKMVGTAQKVCSKFLLSAEYL
jgi:hypothetical protein